MTSHEKIEIGNTLSLDAYRTCYGMRSIYFTFTERSPDPWYSNTETEVEINEETAKRIVEALRNHFEF